MKFSGTLASSKRPNDTTISTIFPQQQKKFAFEFGHPVEKDISYFYGGWQKKQSKYTKGEKKTFDMGVPYQSTVRGKSHRTTGPLLSLHLFLMMMMMRSSVD